MATDRMTLPRSVHHVSLRHLFLHQGDLRPCLVTRRSVNLRVSSTSVDREDGRTWEGLPVRDSDRVPAREHDRGR